MVTKTVSIVSGSNPDGITITFNSQLIIMYFKTLKTSETGKKIASVLKRKTEAENEAEKLVAEIGATKHADGYWAVFGGISRVDFEEDPDSKLWKREHDGWLPKRNTKKGKEIYNKIKALPVVNRFEVNEAVGFKGGPFKCIGLNWLHEYYYGFAVGDDWDFTPPEDCIEITVTEYKAMHPSVKS